MSDLILHFTFLVNFCTCYLQTWPYSHLEPSLADLGGPGGHAPLPKNCQDPIAVCLDSQCLWRLGSIWLPPIVQSIHPPVLHFRDITAYFPKI